MPTDTIHEFIRHIALIIEILGVAIILGGIVLAGFRFLREARSSDEWRNTYSRLRSNLGRAILLGLELLVAADIIATITAPLSLDRVAVLGLVVLIRTFLSFALETEIEGCWPWQRAAREGCSRDQRAR